MENVTRASLITSFRNVVPLALQSHYPLQQESYQTAISSFASVVEEDKLASKLKDAGRNTEQRNTIKININGVLFNLSRSTCIRIPVIQCMLTNEECMNIINQEDAKEGVSAGIPKELFFERNPTVFAAIVDYVQNNELHVPPSICPKLFAREIVAWGFDIDEVESCCFSGLVHFLWEQDKLQEFHGFLNTRSDDNDCNNEQRQGGKSDCDVLRNKLWIILDEPFSSDTATIYFYVLCMFVLLAFVTMMLESVDEFDNWATMQWVIHGISYVTVGYLTLDFFLRLGCCPERKVFMRQVINLTDLFALLASYGYLIENLAFDGGHIYDINIKTFLQVLEVARLLRVLRILRPMSKVTGFRLIYFTLKCSSNELLLVFMLLMFLVLIFASLIYYVGNKDGKDIPSILDAMWFCLITLTTVGFGDIVPCSVQTKVVGSIVAVFGIIVTSMTMPVMVSNFNSLYINAVVGQPKVLKKLQDDLELELEHIVEADPDLKQVSGSRSPSDSHSRSQRNSKEDVEGQKSVRQKLRRGCHRVTPNCIQSCRPKTKEAVISRKLRFHSEVLSREDNTVAEEEEDKVPEYGEGILAGLTYDTVPKRKGRHHGLTLGELQDTLRNVDQTLIQTRSYNRRAKAFQVNMSVDSNSSTGSKRKGKGKKQKKGNKVAPTPPDTEILNPSSASDTMSQQTTPRNTDILQPSSVSDAEMLRSTTKSDEDDDDDTDEDDDDKEGDNNSDEGKEKNDAN